MYPSTGAHTFVKFKSSSAIFRSASARRNRGLASPITPRSAIERARPAFDRSRSAVIWFTCDLAPFNWARSSWYGILVVVIPLIGHPLVKQNLGAFQFDPRV